MKHAIFILVLTGLILSSSGNIIELKLPKQRQKGVKLCKSGYYEVSGTTLLFADVSVKPHERLRVSINARVKSGTSIEKYGAMETLLPSLIWHLRKSPWKLPTLGFEYRNSNNKRLSVQYHGPLVPIYSNGFKNYKTEFYIVNNAKTVRVFIRANDKNNVVEIKSATIEKVDVNKEKYLNINPELKFGKFNPAGYGYANKGALTFDEGGKNYLEIGDSWLVGDCIPVKAGDKLHVLFSGKADTPANKMRFSLMYCKSPSIKKSEIIGKNRIPMVLSGKKTQGMQDVIVPKGANYMRISLSGGTMNYIKIEKK